MKQKKVVNVSYRKDSISFQDWMKYEVTLIDEEGVQETIPAYGKDLQDALSRVVHDWQVEEVEKTTKRIPDVVWVILWFGYMLGLLELTYMISPENKIRGVIFLGGMSLITGLTFWAKAWFRMRNIDK